MRHFPIPLFSALMLLPAFATQAISFQPRLEQVQWSVEGDQFECRLSQPIANFGSGEFVRRAGEQVTFRVKASERWFGQGSATLYSAAAPWRPEIRDINLGRVQIASADIAFNSSQEQGVRLLNGVLEGRSPLVRHRTLYGGEALEVRLLPARFDKAYDEYLACTAKLLPVNFEQIRQMQLSFTDGGIELDGRAKAKIEIVLDFMKADPSINSFQIDGHSDNAGNRLANRDLSRRRALAVQEYLKSRGIAPEQITMRFHGESYPLVPNNSAANRAQNRRATLTLERLPVAETAPVAAPAAATN